MTYEDADELLNKYLQGLTTRCRVRQLCNLKVGSEFKRW